MLAATIIYEFETIGKGASWWTESIEEKEQPKFRDTNINCDLAHVDKVILSNGVSIRVFWSKEIVGDDGDMMRLKQKAPPYDLALIATCDNQCLIVRSLLLMDGRLGISISTERGYTLYTGIADIYEYQSDGQRLLQLIGNFEAVYSFPSFNPLGGCASCAGAVRKSNRSTIPKMETPDGGQP